MRQLCQPWPARCALTTLWVCCRVTVDGGITTDVAGNPNTAASQVLKYRPPSQAVSAVSKTANAVVAGSIAASLATGLLAGNVLLPLCAELCVLRAASCTVTFPHRPCCSASLLLMLCISYASARVCCWLPAAPSVMYSFAHLMLATVAFGRYSIVLEHTCCNALLCRAYNAGNT